jgi:CheY-like chemotaxis protein
MQENIDLIILEFVLPDMEGLEVCRIIRANPRLKDIPVLFLTEAQDSYQLLQCFGADADGFLNKPVQPEEFMNEVEYLLRKEEVCLK